MDFITALQNLITEHLNAGDDREDIVASLEQALDGMEEEGKPAVEGEDDEEEDK